MYASYTLCIHMSIINISTIVDQRKKIMVKYKAIYQF